VCWQASWTFYLDAIFVSAQMFTLVLDMGRPTLSHVWKAFFPGFLPQISGALAQAHPVVGVAGDSEQSITQKGTI
jgi:hypothetical protein